MGGLFHLFWYLYLYSITMGNLLQENITRLKELIYDKKVLNEDTMSGLQGGYADTDGANEYSFTSKGALGSEPELGEEGFTEPETNYSKEDQAYDFYSDGPQDSYAPEEFMEQEDGTGTGESDDGAGAGTASLGPWESGITRGSANQIINSKWSDNYQPSRGKSNPLW